jgi:hypothetical protein
MPFMRDAVRDMNLNCSRFDICALADEYDHKTTTAPDRLR